MGVTIDIDASRDPVCVRVAGDLDEATADELRAAVDDLLAEGRAHLVVDLERLEFLGSAGMSALVRARKAAQAAGGDLLLVAVPARIHAALRAASLDTWFGLG